MLKMQEPCFHRPFRVSLLPTALSLSTQRLISLSNPFTYSRTSSLPSTVTSLPYLFCFLFYTAWIRRSPPPSCPSISRESEEKIAAQSEFLRLPQQLDRDQWSVQEEDQDKIRLFRRQTLRSLFQFTES